MTIDQTTATDTTGEATEPPTRVASGIPARGTTRPPFPPGNALHMTHGARSPRVFLPLADALTARLLADRPDLAGYPETLARWSVAEAKAALLRRYLDEVGILDENGTPRSKVLKELNAAENRAEKAGTLLGLDPMSEARLSRERATATALAVDLAGATERGRAILDAHAANQNGDGPGNPAALAAAPDPVGEALARVAAAGRESWQQANAEHLAATGANTASTATTTEPEGDDQTPEGEA